MCVSNVARAAGPKFGDRVAVVGCGAMGLLTIAALKSDGLTCLIAVDQIESRLEFARLCGATHTIDSSVDVALDAVMNLTESGADVVVEFTGLPSGLELAGSLLRMGQGRLIMAGYHHSPDTYDLRQFAYKGLVAHSPHPNYSPDVMADYRRGISALARGVFPMDRLVTHEFSLDSLAEGFESLISHAPGYIKGVAVPPLGA